MLIRCPECQFERSINTASIPASATMATCPKCGRKFRFREPGEMGEGDESPSGNYTAFPAEDSAKPQGTPATSQEGDDPLPPGAMIPHFDSSADKSETNSASAEPSSPSAASEEDEFKKSEPLRKAARSAPQKDEENYAAKVMDAFRRPSMDEASAREVPWERIDLYGYSGGFYHTVLRVLFHAPEFYANIRSANTPVRGLIFYIIMGVLQILTLYVWQNAFFQVDAATPQAEAMVNGAMGPLSLPMLLLLSPFASLIQALVLAGLYHLMFRLSQPDKADFPVTLRVICYSAAPYIICVVPVLGHLVAFPWFVACTFVGCKYALNLSWSRTALALAPLFILGLAMMQFAITAITRAVG